jgi:hypothetical protein
MLPLFYLKSGLPFSQSKFVTNLEICETLRRFKTIFELNLSLCVFFFTEFVNSVHVFIFWHFGVYWFKLHGVLLFLQTPKPEVAPQPDQIS